MSRMCDAASEICLAKVLTLLGAAGWYSPISLCANADIILLRWNVRIGTNHLVRHNTSDPLFEEKPTHRHTLHLYAMGGRCSAK